MKLSEVIPFVVQLLSQAPQLQDIEILSSVSLHYNKRMEAALRTRGLALVVMQPSGEMPTGKGPQLLLKNAVIVSVLESPATNTTGKTCLQLAEAVLEVVHQANWPAQRGLQNVLTVDTPAYEAGPLDGGLVTYFCNFQVTTIQPIHE